MIGQSHKKIGPCEKMSSFAAAFPQAQALPVLLPLTNTHHPHPNESKPSSTSVNNKQASSIPPTHTRDLHAFDTSFVSSAFIPRHLLPLSAFQLQVLQTRTRLTTSRIANHLRHPNSTSHLFQHPTSASHIPFAIRNHIRQDGAPGHGLQAQAGRSSATQVRSRGASRVAGEERASGRATQQGLHQEG